MTKVKICGLSNIEAVKTAVSAGADYIGFVFAPSKRQVTLEQAAELAKFIPSHIQKVGVFVSPGRAELLEAVDKVGLDFVQVHGQVVDKLFETYLVPVFKLYKLMGMGMYPILRQIIYSLMLLWQGVAKPLTGADWIRLD